MNFRNLDIISVIKQTLPNHLWVNSTGSLIHIDHPNIDLSPMENNKVRFINVSNTAIGFLSILERMCITVGKDLVTVRLYNHQIREKAYYQFLKEIGGNAEIYKEMMLFVTGSKLFK